MVQIIGPEQGRDGQAHSELGVASWHLRRSEVPMRWALLGIIEKALVTSHDALRREPRLMGRAGRSQFNIRKGFAQPHPQLLSNEVEGSELPGTRRLQAVLLGGESREQI